MKLPGHGVDHPPHLAPRLRMNRAIPLQYLCYIEHIKYTLLCVTLILSKSKQEYIKLHGFFEKKSCTISVLGVENISCQNKLCIKFCFTLICFRVEPNFLRGKILYFELHFRKTLFFIQNINLNITSAINPPLETILPIRIAIY